MAPKGTTQRVSDGDPVDFADAKQAWADAARPVLERVAGTYNLYIEYKDLAESVQQDTGITTGVLVHHWIGSVLSAVAARASGARRADALRAVRARRRHDRCGLRGVSARARGCRPRGPRSACRHGTPRVLPILRRGAAA